MWHSNSFGLLKGEKYGIPGFGAKMGCLNHKDHKAQSITKIKNQALPQGHESRYRQAQIAQQKTQYNQAL
jgi:hypothetical protein